MSNALHIEVLTVRTAKTPTDKPLPESAHSWYDYNERQSRRNLSNHLLWALSHNMEVTIRPVV